MGLTSGLVGVVVGMGLTSGLVDVVLITGGVWGPGVLVCRPAFESAKGWLGVAHVPVPFPLGGVGAQRGNPVPISPRSEQVVILRYILDARGLKYTICLVPLW